MAHTQQYMLSCDTGKISAQLPVERTRLVPGLPPSAAPLPDSAVALRHALANPVGMPALEKLLGKGSKVTIAIQDGAIADITLRMRIYGFSEFRFC